MKLVIGDDLQTLFHPIVNATKPAAEETRKQLTPMKKTLMDIDGALAAQGATDAPSRPPPIWFIQERRCTPRYGKHNTTDRCKWKDVIGR